MRKAKLPTLAKKRNPCVSCGAHTVHIYDYDNQVYKWQCTGCGSKRYEPKVRFEARFQQASEI
jgi:DNA-directed RNA polymerase subunit RPC12/RpoP